MQQGDDGTLRVSSSDVEAQAAPKPLEERELSTIFERVFTFVWLLHDEPVPDVLLRIDALRRQLGSLTEEVRQFWRAPARGLAELDRQAGRLSDIGGGGLGVATARPVAAGLETRVRVPDEEAGWLYEFPCTVVWATAEPEPRIGLRFTGRPQRVRMD